MARKVGDSSYALSSAFSRIGDYEMRWADGSTTKHRRGVLLSPQGIVDIQAWPDFDRDPAWVHLETVVDGRAFYRSVYGVEPSDRGLANMAGRFLTAVINDPDSFRRRPARGK
jgi:hypothetical protein